MIVDVLPDADAVARRAAELLAAARGHVALSGGSTPERAYALAASADLSGATFWLGDERMDGSNLRMATEALGAPVEAVRTDLGLDAAAADYDRRLSAALGDGGRLALALMGLGPDGHTASLFPGKPEVEVRDRLAAAVPEAGMEPRVPRVTLTLTAFNAAQQVVFLVAGADKAQAVRRAFGDPPDRTSPAALVRPPKGDLLVLVDEAAAAGL